LLEALSVGRTAYSRLNEREEGTVHGVFDAAINILFPKGLVSLVPSIVQRGPLNITLQLPADPPKMSSLKVKAGDKAKVQGSNLQLGDSCLIRFGSARIYSPRRKFKQPMLADNEIEANLEVMRKTALLFGNLQGLGQLFALTPAKAAGATVGNLNIFASFAIPRIARLERAFHAEEKEALRFAVSELIGLGPGLTPSSDDMLAGLILLCVLYAKNRGRMQRATRLTAQVIAEESRSRTTILSEEYLMQAASGRGNEPVIRLCTALLTGGQESVEQETRRMATIGGTSGTDTVLGIVLGTMFCMGIQSILTKRESG
jgi:hypothetical protein